MFSNICLKKCATPLSLKSIQVVHEVKLQVAQSDKTSLENFKLSGNPISNVSI